MFFFANERLAAQIHVCHTGTRNGLTSSLRSMHALQWTCNEPVRLREYIHGGLTSSLFTHYALPCLHCRACMYSWQMWQWNQIWRLCNCLKAWMDIFTQNEKLHAYSHRIRETHTAWLSKAVGCPTTNFSSIRLGKPGVACSASLVFWFVRCLAPAKLDLAGHSPDQTIWLVAMISRFWAVITRAVLGWQESTT